MVVFTLRPLIVLGRLFEVVKFSSKLGNKVGKNFILQTALTGN